MLMSHCVHRPAREEFTAESDPVRRHLIVGGHTVDPQAASLIMSGITNARTSYHVRSMQSVHAAAGATSDAWLAAVSSAPCM